MGTLTRPSLADKVAFLRDPRSYAGRVHHVQVIETHFAWIFLTPRHAYKLKKPVRHAAMNYRSLAARKRGCLDEVRLNRRLAPTVYLSVVPLTLRSGSLRLGGVGRIEDWVVKMRRLAAAGMLDRVLRRRSLRADELSRVVMRLATFFTSADPAPVNCQKYVRRCRREVTINRKELERKTSRLRPSLVRAVACTQSAFVAQAGELLGKRGAHVVEGHGDLRAEHVWLGSPRA